MKPRHVLAMVNPMSAERVSGIARYAKELGVNVPEELAILSIGNNPLVCENQSANAAGRRQPS